MGRRGNYNTTQFTGAVGGTGTSWGAGGTGAGRAGGGPSPGKGGSFGGSFGGGGRGYTGSQRWTPSGKPGSGAYGGAKPWNGWQNSSNSGSLNRPTGTGNTSRGVQIVNDPSLNIGSNGGRSNIGSGNTSKGVRFVDRGPYGEWPGGKYHQPKPRSGSGGDFRTVSPRTTTPNQVRTNFIQKAGNAFTNWIANKGNAFKNFIGNPFGRGTKKDTFEETSFVGPPLPESRGNKVSKGTPPFLGGQVEGALYRFRVRYEKHLANGTVQTLHTNFHERTGPLLYAEIQNLSATQQRVYVYYTSNGNKRFFAVTTTLGTSSVEYKNAQIVNVTRVDGTSQDDDRENAGDPPSPTTSTPPMGIKVIFPPRQVPFTSPPPIKIPWVNITLHGPGGFFGPPPGVWDNEGKPDPIANPTPGTGTSSPATPNPSETPHPQGFPVPEPIRRPTRGTIDWLDPSFGTNTGIVTNTGTGTSTGTGTATSTGTGTGTSTGTGTTTVNGTTTTTSTSTSTGNSTTTTTTTTPSPSSPFLPSPVVPIGEPVSPVSRPVPEQAKGKLVPTIPPIRPPAPPGAGQTSKCSGCSKAIGAKVDRLGHLLGAGNLAAQGVDLGLLAVINSKLGPQVPGGISTWLGKFS